MLRVPKASIKSNLTDWATPNTQREVEFPEDFSAAIDYEGKTLYRKTKPLLMDKNSKKST